MIHSTTMRTSLLAVIALALTACSGAPFTTAEMAAQDQGPTSGVIPVAVTPEAAPTPDAGPTEAPDASPTGAAPGANPTPVDAGMVPQEAAAPQPEPEGDAGAAEAAPPSTPVATTADEAGVSTPTLLCDTVAQAKLFVASTSEVDFVAGVGTVTMKRITLTDESQCSASISVSPMGSQGEFEVVSNCDTLDPGQSCTMTVTFLPTSVGRSVASWSTVILGQVSMFTAVGMGE